MTTTRVCVRAIPDSLSLGIKRVASALQRYAPDWATIVEDPKQADLWVIHVIGHGSMIEVPTYPGDIAMIQYCLRTTEDPSPTAWMPHWLRAKAIWSYYDLQQYCEDHDAHPPVDEALRFLHMPLGVDGDIFKPSVPTRKPFLIGTSGYIAGTECVTECVEVAKRLKRAAFHLGPDLDFPPHVMHTTGVTDETLADLWSQCTFVAGMRRIEGFELPAVEALACGSRPIMFDQPHYTHWFGEHADYVPEGEGEPLVQAIMAKCNRARYVSRAERDEVLRKFNWRTVATQFWEALR